MHFRTVIVLKKCPSMCKQIPMVETPYAIFSLCIHAVLIVLLVTGRKLMSSRPFSGILAKLSPQICLGCLSFCFLNTKYCIIKSLSASVLLSFRSVISVCGQTGNHPSSSEVKQDLKPISQTYLRHTSC